MACVIGSGLPIGLEGPFIHQLKVDLSAIMARQLTRIPGFKHIDRRTKPLRMLFALLNLR